MNESIRLDFESKTGEIVKKISPCTGGCTAESFLIETQNKKYFLKTLKEPSDVFKKEVNGLNELSKSKELKIPEIVFYSEKYLCLKWIDSHRPNLKNYISFGKILAKHHRSQGKACGFYEDNYIGRTNQINTPSKMWNEFFLQNRLVYQYNLLKENKLSTPFIENNFEKVIETCLTYLDINEVSCSPLHGDLWGGNHLMNENEEIVLIDPAFYYGHREADLALMKMFGSFPSEFFQSYEHEWPLCEGHEMRFPLYQLYHGLNHINLEGHSYLSLAENAIKEIISI